MPSPRIWSLITLGDMSGAYGRGKDSYKRLQAATTAMVRCGWSDAAIKRTLRVYATPGTPGAHWAHEGHSDGVIRRSLRKAKRLVALTDLDGRQIDRDPDHAAAVADAIAHMEHVLMTDGARPRDERVLPSGGGAIEARIILIGLLAHARRHAVGLEVLDDGSVTVGAACRDVGLAVNRGAAAAAATLVRLRRSGGAVSLHARGTWGHANTYALPAPPKSSKQAKKGGGTLPDTGPGDLVSSVLPPLLDVLSHDALVSDLPHRHGPARPLPLASGRAYLLALLAANPHPAQPLTPRSLGPLLGLTARGVRDLLDGLSYDDASDGTPGLGLIERCPTTGAVSLADMSTQALLDRLDGLADERGLRGVRTSRSGQIQRERQEYAVLVALNSAASDGREAAETVRADDVHEDDVRQEVASQDPVVLAFDLDLGGFHSVIDLRGSEHVDAQAHTRRLRGSPPTTGAAVA